MKQTILALNKATAPYDQESDAYLTGVVTPDDTQVVVIDAVVHREFHEATIYYVVQDDRIVEDEAPAEVESGDEASLPE
jgi:hypothetical protein